MFVNENVKNFISFLIKKLRAADFEEDVDVLIINNAKEKNIKNVVIGGEDLVFLFYQPCRAT